MRGKVNETRCVNVMRGGRGRLESVGSDRRAAVGRGGCEQAVSELVDGREGVPVR